MNNLVDPKRTEMIISWVQRFRYSMTMDEPTAEQLQDISGHTSTAQTGI